MKDVIFVEDSRNMPIGRVIKVDGQHTVVHFPVGGEKNPAPPSAPAGNLIEFLDEANIAFLRLPILVVYV